MAGGKNLSDQRKRTGRREFANTGRLKDQEENMLTHTGRRVLNRALQSLVVHNESTEIVLERLVEDLHEHPLLVPYQMINHEQFEDLIWGIIQIMDTKNLHAPSVSGNAAYVLGAILDTDVGKDKIFRLFSDPHKLDQHKYILPNLTAIMESGNEKAAINSSGTLSVMVETEVGRTWALRQPSFDWVLHLLAKSLTSKKHLLASNCSLALARICLSEEGCSRILNFRNSKFIVSQLIKSLGVDKEGIGMNSAYALAHICDKGPGLKNVLSSRDSNEMFSSLLIMLCSEDEGCSKNACFALRNIANKQIGQDRLLRHPDIDRILLTMSKLLMHSDEETAKFAAAGLRHLAEEKEGYLRQKDHPLVKPTLRRVLTNPAISYAYRKEAHMTLKNLLLQTPEKPKVQVLDAHSMLINWDKSTPRSGLPVTYGLYLGDEMVYEGQETSYIMSDLKEMTNYEFKIRAWTNEDEESSFSEVASATTFRAVSSEPRGLRAVSITASQVKFEWHRPERVYGVLSGYKVCENNRDIRYEPVYTYHIAGNLKPDTEYTFEVSAITKRGEGEKAMLTVRTLRQDLYAPSKPKLIAIGPREILATWTAPIAPIGRINGYELLVDGKRHYYGLDRRCLISMLQPDTEYEFNVVAWTNEGKCESEPATKRTPLVSKGWKSRPWKTKEDLLAWLSKHESSSLPTTSRSIKSSSSGSQSYRSFTTSKSQSEKSTNVNKRNSSQSKSSSSRCDTSRNGSTKLTSIQEKRPEQKVLLGRGGKQR
eukprot:gene11951-13188_t